MFISINPFTEEPFGETSPLSDSEQEKKLHISEKAFQAWSQLSWEQKKAPVENLSRLLKKEKSRLATLITKEMGKPLWQAEKEIEKCASLCDYTAQMGKTFLSDELHLPHAPKKAYVTYQPLGVILGIMPWNFPFWQVFRFAVPTILVGNSVVIKQAPNVMLCAEELEKLFISATFPKGVYQNLAISVEQASRVIADPCIKGVSLTGSVKAGRAVSALAGKHLKKTVLELGGSDPYLILDSADLPMSAKECVLSRMNNSGQSCIAAKRLIVTQKKAEEFSSLVKQEMQKHQLGDPMRSDTLVGPLARKDLRDLLHHQVQTLKNKGLQVLLGGEVPTQKGYFYPPTVLMGSASLVKDFKEELFGPVVLIIEVSDEEEALRVANDSPYGLGAAVFSQDREKAEHYARQGLQAGACAINQALHSHPALPFGGVKDSGYGRELASSGFYEFANKKTIYVNH